MEERNVLGGELKPCSTRPLTGYFRDGCCKTDETDSGLHLVCAEMTAEFLAYSRARGNDLTTPAPAYGFPGLKPGDRWCVCVGRWLEAYEAGMAPPIFLTATHENALRYLPLERWREFSAE